MSSCDARILGLIEFSRTFSSMPSSQSSQYYLMVLFNLETTQTSLLGVRRWIWYLSLKRFTAGAFTEPLRVLS